MSENKAKESSWILKYVQNGKDVNKTFNLNYGLNSIGRALSNSIVLDNATISRHHCQLWIENNNIPIIKDLGSVNGTVVQEMQLEGLEDYILKENDTIFLSDSLTGVQLQLCVDECNEISRYQSLRTHFQTTNVPDPKTSLSNNDGITKLDFLTNIRNGILKNENYYELREKLATEWAVNFQKLINSNSSEF